MKKHKKDLNQVMFTPTQKSKKKLYRIVFMKCSDHVGIFSNQCINENARCLGWIKLESLQAFCPSVVTSLLIRKKKNTGNKVSNFYKYTIWYYWSGYIIIYTQHLLGQRSLKFKDCSKRIVKLRNLSKGERSCIYLQKSSEFLSIQKNLIDTISKFWFTTRFSFFV